MEESTKKFVMIGIIVVCFVSAAAIVLKTRRHEGPNLDKFKHETVLVLCLNENCQAQYEVNAKKYLEFLRKHRVPRGTALQGMTCKECGEPSVYRAIKCEKCGFVFELGSIPRTYEDRCPKCGYSKLQEARKAAISTENE